MWRRMDHVLQLGPPPMKTTRPCFAAVQRAPYSSGWSISWFPFPQFGQFDITRDPWRAGTSGSMGRTSGAVFPRQRTTSWQLPNATHGGRFTRRCTRATPSRRPCLSVRQDTLFWTREVYEKIKTFSRGRPPTRTSMDYAPPQKGKNKSKGKGKSRGKPGNKGKGKPTSCAQHHQAGPGGFPQELGWVE